MSRRPKRVNFEYVADAPLPKRNPSPPHPIWVAIEKLQVGQGAVDIQYPLDTVLNNIYRYRCKVDRTKQYIARKTKPGWTRVWRTK